MPVADKGFSPAVVLLTCCFQGTRNAVTPKHNALSVPLCENKTEKESPWVAPVGLCVTDSHFLKRTLETLGDKQEACSLLMFSVTSHTSYTPAAEASLLLYTSSCCPFLALSPQGKALLLQLLEFYFAVKVQLRKHLFHETFWILHPCPAC